jgi:hypothetical protein
MGAGAGVGVGIGAFPQVIGVGSCAVLRWATVSCPVLSYPVLSCTVLPYLICINPFKDDYGVIISFTFTLTITSPNTTTTTTNTTTITYTGHTDCTARQGEEQTELLGSHLKVIKGQGQGQGQGYPN